MQKIINKTIASLLIVTFMFSYFSVIGIYGSEAIAASIDSQNAQTGIKNVEFDSRFSNGKYQIESDINSENERLIFYVNVKGTGYLKDAKISFEGKNFEIIENNLPEGIEEISQNEDSIKLNIIKAGSVAKIAIPIKAIKADRIQPEMVNKNTKVKFSAIYVDENGNENKCEKEIFNQIAWKSNVNIKAKQTLTKYIPFETNKEKGVIIQTSITSGIENNVLPIGKTEIIANVSKIANKVPSKVFVEAKRTSATDGNNEHRRLSEKEYAYNKETDTLKILVENKKMEDGTVSWNKTEDDEYLITYVYTGDEVYEATKTSIAQNFKTNIKITTFDGKENTTDIDGTIELKDGIGKVVDFDNINIEESLSKGYAYANFTNETEKIETEYTQIISSNVSYVNLVDKIEIAQNSDTYLDKANKEYDSLDIYNKKVLVSESNFIDILGEKGWIEIYDEAGKKLYTINKEIGEKQKDDLGNYYIDTIEDGISNFTFVTSKPIKEGKLSIVIKKAIKGETEYKRSQLEIVENIKTKIYGLATLEGTQITKTISENVIEYKEPVTKAEINIETKELSTAEVNENVKMNIALITDSVDDALFKNPTLNIRLPEYIDKLEIKDINLVYGNDELSIEDYRYNENNKILTIQLRGIQTKYSIGAISKGAVIALTSNITVNKLTPNQNSKITMQYTNGNSSIFEKIDEEGLGYAEADIKVVAPTGLVTLNGIEGYSEQETGVQSISSGEEQVGTLSIHEGIKKAKVIGKIVNNLGNTAKNVSILGRTPFKGNKTIDTQKDLGTNIDTLMLTKINLEGINADIYYSENGEATKDLNLQKNAWTKEPQNLNKVKSYMIVLKENLQKESLITFTYDVEIPADLPYDCSAYTTYKVYYNNNTEVGDIPQSSEATSTGVTTEEGPKLEVDFVLRNPGKDNVREGQLIKAYLTVKNVGDRVAEGVNAKINLPDYAIYSKYAVCNAIYEYKDKKEINLKFGTLGKGEAKTETIYLRIGNKLAGIDFTQIGNEGIKQVADGTFVRKAEISSEITAINMNTLRTSMKFNISNGVVYTDLIGDLEDKTLILNGEKISFKLMMYNRSFNTIEDVNTTIDIPDYLEYVEAYRRDNRAENSNYKNTDRIEYNKDKKQIIIKNPEFKMNDVEEVIIVCKPKNDYSGEVQLYAKTRANNIEHYSNLEELVTEKMNVEISDLTTDKKYVKEQEEFSYLFSIKNVGKRLIENVRIKDFLPSELEFIEASFTDKDNKEYKVTNLVDGEIILDIQMLYAGKQGTIEIKAKPKLLIEEKDKEIKNKARVVLNGIDTVETNEVTNIIEYVPELHESQIPGVDPIKPVEPKYKISGTAWIDENENGMKEETEQTLSNVKVILLNKVDYSIVKDENTKQEKIITTSSDGKYEFNNLNKGEYIVAYIYESGIYELTTYHKEGVNQGYNSDAIAMDITYEGKKYKGAATDIIKIYNENSREIDIGFIKSSKFDLRLDKYITKISVSSSKGNRTYNYNNANFTKIELPPNAVNGATTVIEYKILVKNEGGVSGYAKKIIDYIPKDMKFSSNLNPNWYLGEDGNVYNTTLENTELKPGETKELKIILTKKLTDNNLGMLTNQAEIYESYNSKGIKDIDSTVNNKVQSEDDYSTASVTVTLITGKIATFIVITLASISIIALGTYGIRKYVVKKI